MLAVAYRLTVRLGRFQWFVSRDPPSGCHVVVVAHDGRKALAVDEKTQFDVEVLDIGLPKMDGYKVARAMSGLSTTTRAMLIALTRYGQPQDISMSKEAGFGLHLAKQIDPETLATLIAKSPRI